MAHTVESRITTPASELRERLDKAERQVPSLDSATIAGFLANLDFIDALFDQLASENVDVRSERGRWGDLQRQMERRAGQIVKLANKAGGYATLRAQNAPAGALWWQLDTLLAQRRRRQTRSLLVTLAVVAFLLLGAAWAYQTWLAPDEVTILLVDSLGDAEQRAAEQDWIAGLATVENALQTLPDNVELLIWAMVFAERLGDDALAQTYAERAQAQLAGNEAAFQIQVGSTRFQTGDVEGAASVAEAALRLAPAEPQVYFLLGNVAEARGDIRGAIEAFARAGELADPDNPQLAVVSKMRYGMLLQQLQVMPDPALPTLPEDGSAEMPADATPTP